MYFFFFSDSHIFLDQLTFLHFKISFFRNVVVPMFLFLEPLARTIQIQSNKKKSQLTLSVSFFFLFNHVVSSANTFLMSYISLLSFSSRSIRVPNPSFNFFNLSSDHSLFLYSISTWKLFKNT